MNELWIIFAIFLSFSGFLFSIWYGTERKHDNAYQSGKSPLVIGEVKRWV